MIRKSSSDLPKEEYSSFVASLYADRSTMLIGSLSAAIASLITYFHENDPNILIFTLGFILTAVGRYVSMRVFSEIYADMGERGLTRKWEIIAILGGMSIGLCLGFWAFYIIRYSESSFSELVAISACLCHMVGVAARNFGADVLVTSQSLSIGLPIVAGLMLHGDMWHIALGVLFIPFFTSARNLAASIRSVFLQVIHSNARIQYMAKHDMLTGLPNRGSFYHLAEAQRIDTDHPSMVAMFDVDDFKTVNDANGHLTGDHLLIEIGRRLVKSLGDSCVISRFGGDEFVVFHSAPPTDFDPDAIANKILDCFDEDFLCLENFIKSNCSIGIAITDSQNLDFDNLLMKADLALYEAKDQGKGSYRIFAAEMDDRFKRKQALRTDLPLAAERNELYLMFQPIYSTDGIRVKCCEALIRWTHPVYGQISPVEFIPLAESIGFISEITSFVIKESMRQCAYWPGEVGVSVNLSAIDVVNPKLLTQIEYAAAAYRLAPERLTWEVTETAILSNPTEATAVLSALRERGMRIALDDFGTGYANFSYLVDIQFDKLKIDRSITMRILEEDRSRVLLEGLGGIAKNLNMLVTVEGVEEQEQVDAIVACGNIDELQGYLLGVPLPGTEVRELLAAQNNSTSPEATEKSA